MKLYICEKPSLAAALASALGKAEKKDGYYEVNGDTVAWLRGHIMRLLDAKEYDSSYSNWRYDILPIVPNPWKKAVHTDCLSIFKTIKALHKKADEVINVGDPDREGQLLVDEVLVELKNKLPTKRLFINAMDKTTIERALSKMEDNNSEKNRNMYYSALGRSYTDWILGINATVKYSLDSGKKLPVGRVKVPILSLVYRRNLEIDNFKSVKHYGLTAYFRTNDSLPFAAVWKPKEDILDEAGRLTNILDVREAEQKVCGKPGIVTKCDTVEKTEAAPLPFSLSTLQRAAGPALGFSPSKTLDVAQKLYEKKLTTYPRSDCNYLPEEQLSDAAVVLDNLKLTGSNDLLNWSQGANISIKSKAFNTSKTDAHHGIIPTVERIDINTLSKDEQNLYFMIAKRYILQFYPIHIFDETVAEIDCEGEMFVAKGKVIKENGWKSIEKDSEKKETKDSDSKVKELPPLDVNTKLIMSSNSINEKNTTPPARFTLDTLIGAMTNAHKYVKDASLKDTLKSVKGIGTEATRSTTLDDLLKAGMLIEKENDKKKKELYVSESAKELIECLPDELTYPDKTALLEIELDKVAKGELTLESLMEAEVAYTTELMKRPSQFTNKPVSDCNDGPECPICKNGHLVQKSGKFGKFWSCNSCKLTFDDIKNKPAAYACPICGKGHLKRKKSKDGSYFWSCSEYANGCKASFSENKQSPYIKICPECSEGYLKKWSGQYGDYYRCAKCGQSYGVTKTGLPDLDKNKKKGDKL